MISASNLRRVANDGPKTPKQLERRQIKLEVAHAFLAQSVKRRQRYAAIFSKLEQWGIPVMRASYERLLEVPETIIEVMRFVGADVREVQVQFFTFRRPTALGQRSWRLMRGNGQWNEKAS